MASREHKCPIASHTEDPTLHLGILEEAKWRFLFHISYEFRTPLTPLLGLLRDVLDGDSATIQHDSTSISI